MIQQQPTQSSVVRTILRLSTEMETPSPMQPQEIGISLKRSPRAMAMAGSFYVTGANARADQYKVWSTNADAVIQRFSSWKTASQMMEEGYETTFNTDFNDDGITGINITVADDDNADGLNDGSTTYQVVDVDVTTATNIKHQKWRHLLRCNPQEIGISLKRSPRAMAMAGSF